VTSWRIRQSYGFGAARVPLAPVFRPSPFSTRESLAEDLASVASEIERLDPRWVVHKSAVALGLTLAIAASVIALAPRPLERDAPIPDLVLIEREPPVAEPLPDIEPVVEPEPEPAAEVAQAEPLPEPPAALPAPPPLAKPAPPEPAPARPAPQLRIDAVAKAPAPPPPTPERVVRQAPAAKPAPVFRIDPVAPSFAVAATASPAGQPAPLRAVARAPARAAPPVQVAFAALPAAPEAQVSSLPVQVARALPRSAPQHSTPATLAKVAPVAPPARYAEAALPAPPAAAARVARTAAPEAPPAPAPRQAFQGVPLGSLAACVSDREEDALKLEVMAAAGARSQCASRAGRYRFVETKNLNAFLMWIERDPARREADRCIELRLALECLAATPNGRTDNG
jgi:hypothetical protein